MNKYYGTEKTRSDFFKNSRHKFRNMSDLFQNISDIFFLCSRSPGKRFVTGTLVNGLMCLYFKRQNTDMLLNTEKLHVAFL